MRQSLSQRLQDLERCRHSYGKGAAAQVDKLLGTFRNTKFPDADSLVRFHDLLLFLRAFPQSAKVIKLTERLLAGIGRQVGQLRERDAVLELFDSEQFSGVANTVVRDTFTYEVALWLAKQHPQQISVEWDIDEQGRQMSVSLPSLLPLLADDCLVEADTPYLDWLAGAAGGADHILPWLLQRLEGLSLSVLQKTAWYDALRINIVWELRESAASRTHARRNPRQMFYHREPLIRRNQVSLADELSSGALPIHKLSRKDAEDVLNLVRDAITVRYRELWGTTRGDPESVVETEVGRGVQIFLWGLPPDRRLPLRAYHAGMTLKNGVPINYIEGISLFEWMEVGFNTFYTYREGETAWIYSKVLHLLHQVAGVTCFSVYTYQLGHENEEAIKSGAYWFYRKLGFRPGRPELLALTEREEAKMTRDAAHRTSAAALRKLAAGHVFYELGEGARGQWDTFSTRNIGFAVERWMASRFQGDPEKMYESTIAAMSQILNISAETLNLLERSAFKDFAPVLSLVPDLERWSGVEKEAVIEIIRAKAAADEADYLRCLQSHAALRNAFLRLGSARDAANAHGANT
jgi:hypothetical protein